MIADEKRAATCRMDQSQSSGSSEVGSAPVASATDETQT
jgi:hypothetical protein